MDKNDIFNRIAKEPTLLGDLLRKMKVIHDDDTVDLDLLAAYMRNDNLKII